MDTFQVFASDTASSSKKKHKGVTEPKRKKPKTIDHDDLASFDDLGLQDWLVKTCHEVGVLGPTLIQRKCIPPALQGRDIIGSDKTGSGKTAAFALPIIQALSEDLFGVFALVLTPTRELAFQIADQFKAFGAPVQIRISVIVGGMDMTKQALALEKRPHVVVATPGRLADLIRQNDNFPMLFRRVRYLVLDEADRLLEEGFQVDLGGIIGVIPPPTSEGEGKMVTRRTMLFSATMTKNMERLQELSGLKPFVFDATPLQVTTVETLKQQYIFIPADMRIAYLVHLLTHTDASAIIIFTATRRDCQLLYLTFKELGIDSAPLHSQASQAHRLASLGRFKSGLVKILVATDVASRGLDIPEVELVINFDVPKEPKTYVHRVGRTARAGRGGRAVTFVSQYDIDLVHGIENFIGKELECREDVDEEEVLKMMTRVGVATRVARIALIDSGFIKK